MKKRGIRIWAAVLAVISVSAVYGVYNSTYVKQEPFSLGLDLKGGARLTYNADVSNLPMEDIKDAMESLQEVIERRVNAFGVAAPVVRTSTATVTGEEDPVHRLLVELPGVTDIDEAVDEIGKTPSLEFLLLEGSEHDEYSFESTGLTGRLVKGAAVSYPQHGTPLAAGESIGVRVDFNKEGTALFREITSENVGEILAISLDEAIISTPVIQTVIPDGTAIISGGFTAEEAKELARNLNFGALPVNIELEGVETIGASLGIDTIENGVKAGAIGFIAIIIFLILWYRLSGVVAALSLITYVAIMLLLFKWIPVTLTAAGIAGFIITIGIAVDANVLIFERLREELQQVQPTKDAIEKAFKRSWTSIRDGNITSLIIAVILFWFGTSLIKGFALTFAIGILLSMLTAIIFSRGYLLMFSSLSNEKARILLTKNKL